MTENDNQALAVLREAFPELFGIMAHMEQGHLSAEEVGEVIHKMSIIRTADDGFGKIVVEFQDKDGKKWMRIRTIQDKVIRSLPEEEI